MYKGPISIYFEIIFTGSWGGAQQRLKERRKRGRERKRRIALQRGALGLAMITHVREPQERERGGESRYKFIIIHSNQSFVCFPPSHGAKGRRRKRRRREVKSKRNKTLEKGKRKRAKERQEEAKDTTTQNEHPESDPFFSPIYFLSSFVTFLSFFSLCIIVSFIYT